MTSMELSIENRFMVNHARLSAVNELSHFPSRDVMVLKPVINLAKRGKVTMELLHCWSQQCVEIGVPAAVCVKLDKDPIRPAFNMDGSVQP